MAIDTENKKVAQEQPKNKYQQRIENGANEARNAYAELRELYDDPTDEQILAAVGNNLRAYQTQTGNKAGNWGLAFGSNALAGTLNKDTKKSLEDWYQKTKTPTKLSKQREEIIDTIGTGDTAKNITRGMQMDVRNWGNTITDTNAITPEQVRKLNAILGSNIAVPTKKEESVDANGNKVENDVEQTMTRDEIIDILDDEYMDALYTLGFVDEEGNYRTPHAETFEEKLARQERERERIEMLTQQKALQRQKARAGLADLAAGIGDMIKASGGAIVNPRDYRAMYDSLTEQQKTNYNNYLARMQALKEQEKAKQKEAADRAYQEKLLAAQHERDMEKLLQAQGFQSGEAKKERDFKNTEREDEQAHDIEMLQTKLGAAAAENVTKGDAVYINNKRFNSDDSIAIELYTRLNGAKYTDGKKIILSPLPENLADVDKVAIRLNVQKVLDKYDSLPKDLQKSIQEILGTQITEDTSEVMYVNVEDPDDVIPQSVYDKITISAVRNQYKKVE